MADQLICHCGGALGAAFDDEWDDLDHVWTFRRECAACGTRYLLARKTRPIRKDWMMFKPGTALQLKGIYPKLETVDGETRKRVALEFFVQPFTAEMAKDLDIMGNLYARSDGQPIDDVLKIELAITVPLQRMTLASTADSEARMLVENVRVDSAIKVRRDKEGPVLAATFGVDFPYPTPEDLLYLFNNYTNQLSVTFEPQQGSLIEDQEEEAKPRRRRSAAKTTEPETAAEPATV